MKITQWIKKTVAINFQIKLVALFITVVFWFVVFGKKDLEITKLVKLDVLTPKELMVSTDIPSEIHIRIRGPSVLLKALENKEQIIKQDLSKHKAGFTSIKIFPEMVDLPLGTKVVDFYPSIITLQLEPVIWKEVPLKPNLTGELAPGLMLNRLELRPQKTVIYGPRSRINEIQFLETESMDLQSIQKSQEQKI